MVNLTIDESKIPLLSLAIWFFRFAAFEFKVSSFDLYNKFLMIFNISQEEKEKLFSLDNINIDYAKQLTNQLKRAINENTVDRRLKHFHFLLTTYYR